MTDDERLEPKTRLAQEIERLCEDSAGVHSRATIEDAIAQAREALCDAGGQDDLPGRVGRLAREILAASDRAASDRATSDRVTAARGTPPEVLYVCVHNAGRSQMAAALTEHLGGSRVTVRTAGSAPALEIHPAVTEALREIGLDPGREFPKPLTRAFVMAADVVVTMGCGDACPVFPGKRYEDWRVPDPAGLPVEAVRPIRDELRERVLALLASLGVEPARERVS